MQAMFRLMIFILGAIFGVVAAIFILPLPGKTFFNKMSRLPKGTKNLIDDSIDLAISFWKLCLGVVSEITQKADAAIKAAKEKAELVRIELEERKESEESVISCEEKESAAA